MQRAVLRKLNLVSHSALNHTHSLAQFLGEELTELEGYTLPWMGHGGNRLVSLGNRLVQMQMEMHLVEFAFVAFGIDTFTVLIQFLLRILKYPGQSVL